LNINPLSISYRGKESSVPSVENIARVEAVSQIPFRRCMSNRLGISGGGASNWEQLFHQEITAWAWIAEKIMVALRFVGEKAHPQKNFQTKGYDFDPYLG
jgi:hypothetical protein